MRRKEQVKKLVYICLILILVLAILFSGLQILESIVRKNNGKQAVAPQSKTIVRNNIEYYPRQDITVMLVMGIDEYGPVKASGSYNNNGEADMLALLIFDETNEKIDVISINRDTMVDMPALGIGGKNAGTVHRQIAVSHTYGSGLEDSCENTKKTVSDLLYNLHIDYYVAMNMDTIAILNDAVGGVPVTVTEDFSKINQNIPMGETVLQGQAALDYVQTRKDVGDQKNTSRMERQKAYMESFYAQMRNKVEESGSFILEAYDLVDEYIVTDMIPTSMSNVLNRYAKYSLGEMVTLAGQEEIKDGHYQYILDAAALEEQILRMLYAPKK